MRANVIFTFRNSLRIAKRWFAESAIDEEMTSKAYIVPGLAMRVIWVMEKVDQVCYRVIARNEAISTHNIRICRADLQT